MLVRALHAFSCAAFLLAAGGTCAQSVDEERAAIRYEVTPFLGYRGGGTLDIEGSAEDGDISEHFSFGLALNYHIDTFSSYELFYSRQPTHVSLGEQPGALDLDVEYLLIGGTTVIETMSPLQPYIVGLAGISRFSLDAPDARDETTFAISFGVGVRLQLREEIDVRLETRGYLAFVDSGSSMFCRADATGSGCLFKGDGTMFPQFELLAGVAWSF
jgi:hypothetical protein